MIDIAFGPVPQIKDGITAADGAIQIHVQQNPPVFRVDPVLGAKNKIVKPYDFVRQCQIAIVYCRIAHPYQTESFGRIGHPGTSGQLFIHQRQHIAMLDHIQNPALVIVIIRRVGKLLQQKIEIRILLQPVTHLTPSNRLVGLTGKEMEYPIQKPLTFDVNRLFERDTGCSLTAVDKTDKLLPGMRQSRFALRLSLVQKHRSQNAAQILGRDTE